MQILEEENGRKIKTPEGLARALELILAIRKHQRLS